MPNYSSITVPIATRIDIKAFIVVKRRADKRGVKVGQYIRERLEIDALRRR